MRLTSCLGCLCVWAIGACSEPAKEGEFVEDPGKPGTSYGPKCSIRLDLSDAPAVLDQCSAIATINESRAHLYLELYPEREPAGLERYVSIVLPTREWAPGKYTSAIGGRLEISPADGRRYQLSASPAGGFDVDLRLDTVSGPGPEGEFYVRGSLRALLPGAPGTTGDLVLTADISGAP